VSTNLFAPPEPRHSTVSELFDDTRWTAVEGFDFRDVTYHRGEDVPAARIAFDRPAVRNAFRPETIDELYAALDHARRQTDVGCILLTGNGPSPKDGGWAFCSGGDQSIRGESGYEYRHSSEQDGGHCKRWRWREVSPSERPPVAGIRLSHHYRLPDRESPAPGGRSTRLRTVSAPELLWRSTVTDTVGYNFVSDSATTGWRNCSRHYSR
jgi:hypothetical protein